MADLILKRTTYTEKSTIGELSYDGKRLCYTLEDKVRDADEKKVFGKTAIPAGRYKVIVNMSNRFKIMMPLLVNVPGYEGVRIHVGNTDIDTLGCILAGRKKGVDSISESKLATKSLYDFIDNQLKKGSLYITIQDTSH